MTTKVSLAIHPGEHIADELEARNVTAAELARSMGVDAGRVSRLINSRTSVTGDTALRPPKPSGPRRSSGCASRATTTSPRPERHASPEPPSWNAGHRLCAGVRVKVVGPDRRGRGALRRGGASAHRPRCCDRQL